MTAPAARQTIETIARASYGQLLAFLAARAGDVVAAEDALSEAFLAALQRWPGEGVPDKPEAWLLTAARRRLIDAARRTQTRTLAMDELQRAAEEAQHASEAGPEFPDDRLKLLLVCAHPALDPAARTPLMLQTVLGLDAARIAAAFLTSPAAMSQRLVRAKTKIRDAAIPFRLPEPGELPERIEFVLDAIYAAYNAGWEDAPGGGAHHGLATEALWLVRVTTRLLPEEPEAHGLLALLLHCEARRAARRDAAGNFVPLPEQDTARWSEALIVEAEAVLARAAQRRRPGRFQIEAAIQSLHAQRRQTGVIDWENIALLYELLLRHTAALGAKLGHAVALSASQGADAGLAALATIPPETVRHHQPYWATRAHLLAQVHRTSEAHEAYTRAIGLTEDPRVREFLQQRRDALGC
jgi:RNA polymerase sigma-70 factor (ECF subfamily)